MSIDFHGKLTDKKLLRAGYIGCGSHSRRNVLPALKFASVELVAMCDLDIDKAAAFAREFGAARFYSDYKEMLDKEDLDAVFIVTGYDGKLRPLYPAQAIDCMERGVHVWVEKPPAASVEELLKVKATAEKTGKLFSVGFKKMFFPANEKAKELSELPEFGGISQASLNYPQYVPTKDEFDAYIKGEGEWSACSFLDHLCHPVSLMLYLMGMPESLYFERNCSGGGISVFTFPNGSLASISFNHGASSNGGMERTVLISEKGGHIVVDNNVRVSFHKNPPGLGYGDTPSYYLGSPEQTTAVWEPEFSLGQLYNKGLFLLGYYKEIEDFAVAAMENKPVKGGIDDAINVTRIFEAFASNVSGVKIKIGV